MKNAELKLLLWHHTGLGNWVLTKYQVLIWLLTGTRVTYKTPKNLHMNFCVGKALHTFRISWLNIGFGEILEYLQ